MKKWALTFYFCFSGTLSELLLIREHIFVKRIHFNYTLDVMNGGILMLDQSITILKYEYHIAPGSYFHVETPWVKMLVRLKRSSLIKIMYLRRCWSVSPLITL